MAPRTPRTCTIQRSRSADVRRRFPTSSSNAPSGSIPFFRKYASSVSNNFGTRRLSSRARSPSVAETAPSLFLLGADDFVFAFFGDDLPFDAAATTSRYFPRLLLALPAARSSRPRSRIKRDGAEGHRAWRGLPTCSSP